MPRDRVDPVPPERAQQRPPAARDPETSSSEGNEAGKRECRRRARTPILRIPGVMPGRSASAHPSALDRFGCSTQNSPLASLGGRWSLNGRPFSPCLNAIGLLRLCRSSEVGARRFNSFARALRACAGGARAALCPGRVVVSLRYCPNL